MSKNEEASASIRIKQSTLPSLTLESFCVMQVNQITPQVESNVWEAIKVHMYV